MMEVIDWKERVREILDLEEAVKKLKKHRGDAFPAIAVACERKEKRLYYLMNCSAKEEGRRDFAILLQRMRRAPRTEESVEKFLKIALEGRYKESEKMIHNGFYWKGKIFVPAFISKDKSKGQAAFETELRRLVHETKENLKKETEEEIQRFMHGQNNNIQNLKDGKTGIYVFRNGKAAGKVRVYYYNNRKYIEILGSVGRLNVATGIYVPFLSFISGEPSYGLSEYFKVESLKFIKILRALQTA